MDPKKKPLQSKTIWANIIGILALFIAPQVGVEPIVDPEIGAAGLGILNIFLRFFTNKGILS